MIEVIGAADKSVAAHVVEVANERGVRSSE